MVLPDRLVFKPFGIFFRGIFHDVIVMKYQISNIYPTTEIFWLLACKRGPLIVFEQPVAGSPVGECIQFFPKKESVSNILSTLEASGYTVDWAPRKPKIFG